MRGCPASSPSHYARRSSSSADHSPWARRAVSASPASRTPRPRRRLRASAARSRSAVPDSGRPGAPASSSSSGVRRLAATVVCRRQRIGPQIDSCDVDRDAVDVRVRLRRLDREAVVVQPPAPAPSPASPPRSPARPSRTQGQETNPTVPAPASAPDTTAWLRGHRSRTPGPDRSRGRSRCRPRRLPRRTDRQPPAEHERLVELAPAL